MKELFVAWLILAFIFYSCKVEISQKICNVFFLEMPAFLLKNSTLLGFKIGELCYQARDEPLSIN